MTKAAIERNGEAKRRLPQGWRWVRLGEVCDELYRYPSFYGMEHRAEGVPVIRGEHINQQGEISTDWSNYWFVSPEISLNFPRTVLKQGDLVFTVRGTIGKVGFVRESHIGSQLSPNLIRISPSNIIESSFLWNYLRKLKGSNEAVEDSAVTVATVKATDIEKMTIPLPPLHEQKRIAAILNEEIAAVERARVAAEAQLEAAKILPAAYLREVFNSSEARKWPKIAVGKICRICGGKRLPAGTDFSDGPTPYPYIRVVDFENGGVRIDKLKYIDEAIRKEIARYIIRWEDVYISIAGSIGQVGIIPDELDGAQLTENAARLVIQDSKSINRDFLARYLQSPNGQEAIKLRTNKVGQPKLALERIATIEIPAPPLIEQNRITETLQNQLLSSDRTIKFLENQLEEISRLPAALLRQAFKGEM